MAFIALICTTLAIVGFGLIVWLVNMKKRALFLDASTFSIEDKQRLEKFCDVVVILAEIPPGKTLGDLVIGVNK